ncbi:MAG TPA: carboxypeptidase-like regulatory domain-containing protein [Gemmatimonadaceae bacterium]|nr:carboxypeptidase-like regulatory domain-containing protein [Gemmatimonadaceae bacterium]
MSTRLAFRVATLSVVALGCNRYETRPMDPRSCPPEAPARDTFAIAAAPDAAGAVVGIVADDRNARALQGAQVAVTGMRRGTVSDSSGAFRIDSLPAGRYDLVVRQIGYEWGRVSGVSVSEQSGTRVRVPLHAVVLDGCPGFAVVVARKPWWKWW